MITLLHQKKAILNTAQLGGEKIELISSNTFDQLRELARLCPDSWIAWTDCDRDDSEWIDLKNQATVPYKILSKGTAPAFLVGAMDYVEDSPFINFSIDSWYPTWLMTSEMGLIHASILNQIKGFKTTGTFEYDLNLFTKLAQPQGVFCYSKLTRSAAEKNSLAAYSFIAQTKKRRWTLLLLLCHFIYEQRFPILAFSKACFTKSRTLTLKCESLQNAVVPESDEPFDCDVIIPTMGRAAYLKDVLNDLSVQSIVPQKVIIVEQNDNINASTELSYLKAEYWPFEICHKFIHQTGACNARNLALKETEAPWVLFFDDDNRFYNMLIEQISIALRKTKSKILNIAYLQKGEIETGRAFNQWISFGSGCSMVHREVFEQCSFDMALEHGYGEDVDYGMQIRRAGYDIIYAPQIQILHLKAPVGGFRKPHVFPWAQDALQPKPSPQIFYHRTKNYSTKQFRGYKMVQFFKSYGTLGAKTPWGHYRIFKKAWAQSEFWATQLNSFTND